MDNGKKIAGSEEDSIADFVLMLRDNGIISEATIKRGATSNNPAEAALRDAFKIFEDPEKRKETMNIMIKLGLFAVNKANPEKTNSEVNSAQMKK